MTSDNPFEYKEMVKSIEYRLLGRDITEKDTIEGCKLAVSYKIPVVCVKSCYVHQSVDILRGSNTIPATVIGYPFGETPTSIKVSEAKLALSEGVLELNVVANMAYLTDGKDELFQKDLESICCLARMNGALINVIIDTPFLSSALIEKVVQYAVKIGAAWVSPSTGLEGINEEIYLPTIKKAAQGKINIKSMDSIKAYGDWLRKYEMGIQRIMVSDLSSFINSFQKRTLL